MYISAKDKNIFQFKKEMISKTKYFSSYQSPNIVIVPISDEYKPPLKRTKIKNDIGENTNIFQKSDTVSEVNQTESMPEQKNVVKEKQLHSKNISSIDFEHNNSEILEGIPKEMNECDLNTENTVNLKSKITMCDFLKMAKNYTKELSTDSYVNKSEGKLTEPKSLKRSIDKKCEKFTITSRIIREPSQKAEACKIKDNIGTNISNLSDINKIENKMKNKNKMMKSPIQGTYKKNNPDCKTKSTTDETIHNNKIDKPNIKLESTSKESNLCKETKTNIGDNCAKKKAKTRKIIKIVINVTYNNMYEKKDAKAMRESEPSKNPDLSFLDDFDVDEIVDSLITCKNMKENINKGIKSEQDNDNCVIKSSSYTKEKTTKKDKNKLNLSKTSKGATVKNSKKYKKEVQRNEEKHDTVSYTNDRSLENRTNKITVNDGKKDKKVKILDPKTDNVIKTNLSKYEPCEINPIKNHLMIGKNTIFNTESVKEEKYSKNTFKLQKEEITNECSRNEYQTQEVLSRKLEIKMCELLCEKYSINTVEHYGKFSKIFKCTNLVTGKNYAIKMLNECDHYKGKRKKNMLLNVQDEIPKENLYCIFLMNSFIMDCHWCLMTHYYDINLQQVLQNKSKSFHIDEICNLSMQLVLALTVVRNKNIVHSDIKPSHILLNSDFKELKLCGFDEAYYNNFNHSSANLGSVNYRAPELILGYSSDFSIDIWSMALVMYEMATSSMLFTGETNNEILYKQMSTFGNLPYSMIMHSRFSKYHFVGTNFVRNGCCDKEKRKINDFGNDGDLQKMIMDAYEKHWGQVNTKNQMIKMYSFCHLLKKMFVLNPKHRLTIEYVYANNFFSVK